MIRKEVLIVLVTFCLTATLFSIIPVGSQGVREYNPWYDINDDGKIDLKDYYGVGLKYATTGDPTKNVTITGHANKLAYSVQEQTILAGKTFYSPYISVDGYTKMTVSVAWLYGGEYVDNGYLLVTRHFNGTTHFQIDSLTNITHSVKTYDVPNQEILIMLFNNDVAPGYVSLDVYLIP